MAGRIDVPLSAEIQDRYCLDCGLSLRQSSVISQENPHVILPCLLDPPPGISKDFEEGGYDCLVGILCCQDPRDCDVRADYFILQPGCMSEEKFSNELRIISIGS
jgi:hypothetical protein